MSLQRVTAEGLRQVVGAGMAQSQAECAPLGRGSVDFIDRLFDELRLAFPAAQHTFRSQRDWVNTKAMWAEELQKAGVVTAMQYRAGLAVAKRLASPFWPSVGQFIDWCLGDESLEAFERMLRRQPCRDMAEQLARGECGYRCARLPDAQARSLFATVFAKYQAQQRRGEFAAEVVPQIAARSSIPAITLEVMNRVNGQTPVEIRMREILARRKTRAAY